MIVIWVPLIVLRLAVKTQNMCGPAKSICSCARLWPCCRLLWGSASIQYRLFSVCDSALMTSVWISQREMRFRVPAGLQQQQRRRALSGPIITVISLIATPVKMEVLKALSLLQEQRCSRGAVTAEVQLLTTDLLLHRQYWRGQKLFLLPPARMLCFHLCALVDWFVSRMTQKLLNRFARNLDGGWVSAQNRLH